jgi:hypothetical protein
MRRALVMKKPGHGGVTRLLEANTGLANRRTINVIARAPQCKREGDHASW